MAKAEKAAEQAEAAKPEAPKQDAPEQPAQEQQATPAQQQQATPEQQQAAQQLQLDDSNIQACYANFCRVMGSPEELSIDFGFNPQTMGPPPTAPLKVTQRIIVNHYTAKRLLAALQHSVQQHERVFGVLETDVRRRVKPQ